jgi:hypothetical protein
MPSLTNLQTRSDVEQCRGRWGHAAGSGASDEQRAVRAVSQTTAKRHSVMILRVLGDGAVANDARVVMVVAWQHPAMRAVLSQRVRSADTG